jgi:hypothetical protein
VQERQEALGRAAQALVERAPDSLPRLPLPALLDTENGLEVRL